MDKVEACTKYVQIMFKHVYTVYSTCTNMYIQLECGRKLPNRLPNFRLISCLIACLIIRSSLNCNLGFILIGDALRDHPATQEMGKFVPNGRRHGAMAAAGGPAK
jgi:hypothetical protein